MSKKKWTRRGALGLLAGGAGLMAYGSAGFSQFEADRDVETQVTEDETAVLGIIRDEAVPVYDGQEATLLELTNNFETEMENISVEVANDTDELPVKVKEFDSPESLDPGESGVITATLCGQTNGQSKTLELDINVEAGGDTVTLTRTVPVRVLSAFNFERDDERPNDTPAGFISDIGQEFDSSPDPQFTNPADPLDDNAPAYGWSRNHTTETRNRDNSGVAAELDTLTHMVRTGRIPGRYRLNEDGVWQVALTAGEYHVTLQAGDPNFIDSEHSFDLFGRDSEESPTDPPPATDVLSFRDNENDGNEDRMTNFKRYSGRLSIGDDERLTVQGRTETVNAFNPKMNWIRVEDVCAEAEVEIIENSDADNDVISDGPFEVGEIVSVTAEVTNTGDSVEHFPVQFRADQQGDGIETVVPSDDDTEEPSEEIIEVTPSETKEVTLEWQTRDGDEGEEFEVGVGVTRANDGTGAEAIDTVTVTIGSAESELSNLDIAEEGDDATIAEGDEEDVSVEVENVGVLDGEFDVTLEIADSDETLQVDETQTTDELGPEDTETVIFKKVTGGLTEGEYDVTVSTDDDEIDGILTVAIPESELSGLDIAGQGTDATIVALDDEDVSVEVENVGDISGEFDVTLEIEDSGGNTELTQTQTTAELNPDDTETVTFEEVTDDLNPGDYDVTVSTDDGEITGDLTVESMSEQINVDPVEDSAFAATTGGGQGGGHAGVGFNLSSEATVEVVAVGVSKAERTGGSGNSPVRVRSGDGEVGEFVEVEDDNNNADLVGDPFVDLDGGNIDIGGDTASIGDTADTRALVVNPEDDDRFMLLQRFRQSNDNTVNMNQGRADILLVFEDGSDLELDINP